MDAENLLREALAVREPPYAANDPRVLEVEVEMVKALRANGKVEEAKALALKIQPLLDKESSRYVAELRERSTR